jgi:hypothetical protein
MASTKRIIRRALVEVLQSEKATFEERIKAARMLLCLAKPSNSRRHASQKDARESKGSKNGLDDILSKIVPD